MITTEKTHSTN